MATGCNSEGLLCIDFSEALQISWTIALIVLIATLAILVYRVYLENTEYRSSLIQLNELRSIGSEASNATWRSLSIGYSLSIILAGLSTDANRLTFFRDSSTKDALVYSLFLSRLPIAIGAVVFCAITVMTPIFRKRLAFSTTISTANQNQRTNSLASLFFFASVYIMSPFDLAVVKMLPWCASDFTHAYLGYPTSTILYLCVFSNLLSISAQFVAAMILLPSSVAGIRTRSDSYYLSVTGSLTSDEILYWLYLALTFSQFLGASVYSGIIIHHTFSGKISRIESKTIDAAQWQRLSTTDDHSLDMHQDDVEAEIEFSSRNPVVMSAATAANLNKRASH